MNASVNKSKDYHHVTILGGWVGRYIYVQVESTRNLEMRVYSRYITCMY